MKKYVWVLLALSYLLVGCQKNNVDFLDGNQTILVAHRGAHQFAPENTVEAIDQAGKNGYLAVELDVRTSKDGVNFLMHDDSLDRTTNGTGAPEENTMKELEQLKVDTADYPKYQSKDVEIPTFDDAIQAVKKNHLIVNVDGSKGDWEDPKFVSDIVGTLKKYEVYKSSFFVLSDKEIRDTVVKQYPDCTVSWLADNKISIEEEIKKVKAYKRALLSVSNDLATDENLEKLNQAGIGYQVYGVNDKKRLKELKEVKVPMIETDEIIPQ